MRYIKINPKDKVAVAFERLHAGESVFGVLVKDEIERGHKIALEDIKKGDKIIKYGCVIGFAERDISAGEWVHTHNLRTGLSEEALYQYKPFESEIKPTKAKSFLGFKREDGRAAIRNELWIIPTVGCVNSVAEKIAKENQKLVSGSIEGLYAFTHPFGCSQMGDDHAQTRKLLSSLAKHPNAGGVLILGLGCENLTMEQFKSALGEYNEKRIRFLVCQDVEDEYAEAKKLLIELAAYAGSFKREELPVSELVIGMKCGGSDGLSGITANPAVGVFSDRLISMGGSAILTEVPEMFGAESILFERAESEEVFNKAVKMIEDFKAYFKMHGQVVYENPSPGNKAGGISTLEDKSCGCVQKGGNAPIVDVLEYGDMLTKKGLNLLSGPGNDLVSATALTASGAHMVLFTTGRGTPFGAPAPTLKISSNTALFQKKRNWIDFNAGTAAEGESLCETGERLLDHVIAVASGEKTKTEENGFREISIFKDGVVL